MLLLLRSFLFTSLLFLTVVPYAFVTLLAALISRAHGLAVARHWVRLNFWLLKRLCGLEYRIGGRENIPTQTAVVYWKHSSAWETMAQLLIFPNQTWVLKHELLWIPIFGWALKALRPIAIDRSAGSSAVQQVLKQGKERLADGCWVMIFPEGTRMPPGATRRYGMSGALLAAQEDAPIVPVAHNAGDFWPRRGLRKKAGTVIVRIGPPIETKDKAPEQINAEAQTWIEAQMQELSPGYAGIVLDRNNGRRKNGRN